MRFLFLLSLTTFLALTSCSSSKSVVTDQQKFTTVDDAQKRDVNSVKVDAMSGLDLTAYLRRIPGMQVQGSGPDAVVRVRDET